MSPTSFIFKQMAEIGLNVTQALTYLVRQSLRERIRTGKHTWALRALLEKLDERIAANVATEKPVEHIVFDATDEAYVEARRRYGLLNAGGKVTPVPVLKAADGQFYQLPNPLMFKEYVSDVEDLLHADRHPLLVETSQKAAVLTHFFAGDVSYDIIRIDNPVL